MARGRKLKLHSDAYGWMTDEIRELLRAIQPPWVGKKRTSVIRLAFAAAQNKPLKRVFDDPDVCSRNVWYTKWSRQPDVRAAFDACVARVREWIDEETAAIEEHYRQERRRALAQYSAAAPAALATVMTDRGERGEARIKAAETLIRFADPDVAGKVRTGGGLNVDVEVADLDAAIERELRRLADGGGVDDAPAVDLDPDNVGAGCAAMAADAELAIATDGDTGG